jgi:hypothetical protein
MNSAEDVAWRAGLGIDLAVCPISTMTANHSQGLRT